ncbi:hypothetical protein I4U23_030976 [Adineta vaga]|nr:hypothetical protein I4U23_030976 [Adineta vaga]
MGCANTKVHGITEWHTLDELPIEIVFKILDELDTYTIFRSLHHVSKRFNEVLSSYDRYHLNLKLISLKHFHLIASRIRPEQITELTLTDDETSPGLIELFLSKYSMNTLTRLRALTIMQINDEEIINQILISIADHSSLLNFSSITIINVEELYSDIFIELLTSILSKPSLRKAYLDLSYSRTTSNPLPWLESNSIRHLTFIGTCTVSFIRNVCIHTPQLQTLITDDLDFNDENDLNDSPVPPDNDDDSDDDDDDDEMNDSEDVEIQLNANVNNNENQLVKKEKFTSIESVNNLRILKLTSCSFTMLKLQWLLEELTNLKQFNLITPLEYDDETILDGSRWEKFITNLDKFQFVFSVSISNSTSFNIDTCLSTFQKPFWTEVKQWFVSLEKYDDVAVLYSLPYIDKSYVVVTESPPLEYRSTAKKNSLLQIDAMKNVRDLYIDTAGKIENPIENLPHPRFRHVTNLFLHGKWANSGLFLTHIQSLVNLSTIQELTRMERIPTTEVVILFNLLSNLQCLRTNTTFLDALNAAKFSHTRCLRQLIIDSNQGENERPVNTEPFCAMFPRVQYLNIPVDSVESCKYVLEQLKEDLISVVFEIPENDSLNDSDDSDDDDETDDEEEKSTLALFAAWIKELPKEYRSYKKERYIHISLK